MAAYRVARRYHAVYRSSAIGFDAGAAVEVDDEVAAWVNRDSPGTLVPADEPKPAPEPKPDAQSSKPKRGGRRAST